MRLSVIIPTLNEESVLGDTLAALAPLPGDVEIIVSDGGSSDRTCEIAGSFGATLVTQGRGRGAQMAAGAERATGEVFWFLHADTTPPKDACERIFEALADPRVVAGNFRVRFTGTSRAARFMSWIHPIMHGARLSFGDSAIFVRRSVYERVGGFQPYPLFEDLELVLRLLKEGRLVRVPSSVATSSRRFHKRNMLSMYMQWGILLLLYKMGVHPIRLARCYKAVR